MCAEICIVGVVCLCDGEQSSCEIVNFTSSSKQSICLSGISVGKICKIFRE